MSNNFLELDINEPHEMTLALLPIGNIMPGQALNANGWADYRWRGYDDCWHHTERKTWGELLANPDKVEEQLHRHLTKQPQARLIFMLEGVIMQGDMGTASLKPTNSGIWVKDRHVSRTRLSRVYSLLYQFSQYMQVIQTTSTIESAIALSSMFKSDQKAMHDTFNRHIKQVTFTTDSRVTTLMGASAGLGDKRATDIIGFVGTPWNFFDAGYCEHSVIKDWHDITQVSGIGETIVKNVLRDIGRPDV